VTTGGVILVVAGVILAYALALLAVLRLLKGGSSPPARSEFDSQITGFSVQGTAVPVEPAAGAVVRIGEDEDPDGSLEAALLEFAASTPREAPPEPTVFEGPVFDVVDRTQPPLAHFEIDRAGAMHPGPLCTPELQQIVKVEDNELAPLCPACGRRPPKHRHRCPNRRPS